jgi:hypothetical protein
MTFLWTLIMGPLGKALAGLMAIMAVFFAGSRQASQRAKIKGLEADKKAVKDRGRIDDDIDQEPDLAGRARRSGVVRDTKR